MSFNENEAGLVLQLAQKKFKPETIATTLTRKLGKTITALQVQEFLKLSTITSEVQRQRQEIQEQLSTHDGELKYLRDKLRQIVDDDNSSPREKIMAAAEIRQNITSLQKIASMSDEQGDFNVVIVLNDQPQVTKNDGKTIDMEVK